MEIIVILEGKETYVSNKVTGRARELARVEALPVHKRTMKVIQCAIM